MYFIISIFRISVDVCTWYVLICCKWQCQKTKNWTWNGMQQTNNSFKMMAVHEKDYNLSSSEDEWEKSGRKSLYIFMQHRSRHVDCGNMNVICVLKHGFRGKCSFFPFFLFLLHSVAFSIVEKSTINVEY